MMDGAPSCRHCYGARRSMVLAVLLLFAFWAAAHGQFYQCENILQSSSESCTGITENSGAVALLVDAYIGDSCISAFNSSEGPALQVLLSAGRRLPESLVQQFERSTGWRVQVTQWDEVLSAAAGLPPPMPSAPAQPAFAPASAAPPPPALPMPSPTPARRALTATASPAPDNSSNSSNSAPGGWRLAVGHLYDVAILDSELLPGLVRPGTSPDAAAGGMVTSPSQLLDAGTFLQLQAATPQPLRRLATNYRYQTAALPVGTNSLVLYGTEAALEKLYANARMRGRLDLGREQEAGNGSSGSGDGVVAGVVAGTNGTDIEGVVRLPLAWSWEQLVDAAAALHGTDVDGDGAAEYGVCLDVGPGCLGPALLQAVAASFMQVHGASDGVLLDPDTLQWRFDTPAGSAALWVLQRLLSYSQYGSKAEQAGSAGQASPACRRLSVAMAEGRCAFTIHTLTHLQAAYAWPGHDPRAVATTRAMLLPGSTAVYDRATGQLVSCTPYSCPAGVPAAGSGVGGSGGDGDGGSTWGQLWAWLAGPTEAGTGGADGAVVNLAPLVCSSPVGAITISAPYASRTAGAVLLALLASEEGQQALWDDASAGVLPFRPYTPAAPPAPAAANTTATATAAAAPGPVPLSSLQRREQALLLQRLAASTNAAPALRLYGAELAWPVFDSAVAYLYGSDPYDTAGPNQPYEDDAALLPYPSAAVADAVRLLQQGVPAALAAALPGAAELRVEYQASIGYLQPMPDDDMAQRASRSRGVDARLVAGLSVGLGGAALLALLGSAARVRRTLRLQRSVSDDDDSSRQRSTATYVVLEIQGLTSPKLSDAARDQALRQCHDVIKQLARRYNGMAVQLPDSIAMPPTVASVVAPVASIAPSAGGSYHPHMRPSPAMEAAVAAELEAAAAAAAAAELYGTGTWLGPQSPYLPYDTGMSGVSAVGPVSVAGSQHMELGIGPGGLPAAAAAPDMAVQRVMGAVGYGGNHSATELVSPEGFSALAAAETPNAMPPAATYESHSRRRSQSVAVPEQGCTGSTNVGSPSLQPPAVSYQSAPPSLWDLPAIGPPGGASAAPTNVPHADRTGCRSTASQSAMSPTGAAAPQTRLGGHVFARSMTAIAGTETALRAFTSVRRLARGTLMPLRRHLFRATASVGGGTAAPTASPLAGSSPSPPPGASTPGRLNAPLNPLLHDSLEAMLLPMPDILPAPAPVIPNACRSPAMPIPTFGRARSQLQQPATWMPNSAQHDRLPSLELVAPRPTSYQRMSYNSQQEGVQYGSTAMGDIILSGELSSQALQVVESVASGQPLPTLHEVAGTNSLSLRSTEEVPTVSIQHEQEQGQAQPDQQQQQQPPPPDGQDDADVRIRAHRPAVLPNLGLQLPPLPAAFRAARSGFCSVPATPMVSHREHSFSPGPHVPQTSAEAPIPPSPMPPPPPPPPPSARGGALAAAVAAAKAVTCTASQALPTRVALSFHSVHDAVCFSVHLQGQLVNCRWPAEVLELSDCQPLAVRPRTLANNPPTAPGAANQTDPCNGGGNGGDPPAGGASNFGGSAFGGSCAGSGAVAAAEGAGGVVVASAQSSFIVASASPFSPSGAVDRMKSLISGGARGRGLRSPRPIASPRSPGHGSVTASAAGGATVGGPMLSVPRSGPSVSRFAASAASGSGTGTPLYSSAAGLGTRPLPPMAAGGSPPATHAGGSMPLPSFAGVAGGMTRGFTNTSDPWVLGGGIGAGGGASAASLAALSPSGSVGGAWAPLHGPAGPGGVPLPPWQYGMRSPLGVNRGVSVDMGGRPLPMQGGFTPPGGGGASGSSGHRFGLLNHPSLAAVAMATAALQRDQSTGNAGGLVLGPLRAGNGDGSDTDVYIGGVGGGGGGGGGGGAAGRFSLQLPTLSEAQSAAFLNGGALAAAVGGGGEHAGGDGTRAIDGVARLGVGAGQRLVAALSSTGGSDVSKHSHSRLSRRGSSKALMEGIVGELELEEGQEGQRKGKHDCQDGGNGQGQEGVLEGELLAGDSSPGAAALQGGRRATAGGGLSPLRPAADVSSVGDGGGGDGDCLLWPDAPSWWAEAQAALLSSALGTEDSAPLPIGHAARTSPVSRRHGAPLARAAAPLGAAARAVLPGELRPGAGADRHGPGPIGEAMEEGGVAGADGGLEGQQQQRQRQPSLLHGGSHGRMRLRPQLHVEVPVADVEAEEEEEDHDHEEELCGGEIQGLTGVPEGESPAAAVVEGPSLQYQGHQGHQRLYPPPHQLHPQHQLLPQHAFGRRGSASPSRMARVAGPGAAASPAGGGSGLRLQASLDMSAAGCSGGAASPQWQHHQQHVHPNVDTFDNALQSPFVAGAAAAVRGSRLLSPRSPHAVMPPQHLDQLQYHYHQQQQQMQRFHSAQVPPGVRQPVGYPSPYDTMDEAVDMSPFNAAGANLANMPAAFRQARPTGPAAQWPGQTGYGGHNGADLGLPPAPLGVDVDVGVLHHRQDLGSKLMLGLGVRSFGEQVRMTFEAVDAEEVTGPEEGTIIFCGPRVVCGISTWQYGDDSDEDDEPAQQGDAQYDRVSGDSNSGHLEPDQAQDSLMQQQQQQERNLGRGTGAPAAQEAAAEASRDAAVAAGGGEIQAAAEDGAEVDRAACDYYNHANPLYGLPNSADVPPDAAAEQGTHVQPVTEAPQVGGGGGGGADGAQLPAPLRRALALCRAGHGGVVLLDGPTYSATSQEELQEQCMVLHLGDYVLAPAGAWPSLDLYLALDFSHLARLALLRPPACVAQNSLGLLSAPVNAAAICFTLVVGMQTLLAWNTEAAKAALGVLRACCLPRMLRHGGYLVEDADGLLLTAFPCSRAALAWALECQADAKDADWPPELLTHALGEAVYVKDDELLDTEAAAGALAAAMAGPASGRGSSAATPRHTAEGYLATGGGGSVHSPVPGQGHAAHGRQLCRGRHLVFRGLRFKSGLDCGDVLAQVHTTTGRMTYRGRVMNRSARIAGLATAGQVLCSRRLWDDSGLEAYPDLGPEALAVGDSMGEVALKGLSAKMEVIHCVRIAHADMAAAGPYGHSMGLPCLDLRHGPFAVPVPGAAVGARAGRGSLGLGLAHPAEAETEAEEEEDNDHAHMHIGGASDSVSEEGDMDGLERAVVTSGSAAMRDEADAGGPPPHVLMQSVPMLLVGDDSGEEGERAVDGDGALGRASRRSAQAGAVRGSNRERRSKLARGTEAPATAAGMPAGASASAARAAAAAAARIRHASQLQNNKVMRTAGIADDSGSVPGAVAQAMTRSAALRSVSGAVSTLANAALMSSMADDELADRLAAEYSSGEDSDDAAALAAVRASLFNGAGGDDGSGDQERISPGANRGSGPQPGVAALREMFRKAPQRASGIGQAAPAASAGTSTAAASPTGMQGAATVTGMASSAAVGFKKALRAVRRTALGNEVQTRGAQEGEEEVLAPRRAVTRNASAVRRTDAPGAGQSAVPAEAGSGAATATAAAGKKARRQQRRRASELSRMFFPGPSGSGGGGGGAGGGEAGGDLEDGGGGRNTTRGGGLLHRLRTLARPGLGAPALPPGATGHEPEDEELDEALRSIESATNEAHPTRGSSVRRGLDGRVNSSHGVARLGSLRAMGPPVGSSAGTAEAEGAEAVGLGLGSKRVKSHTRGGASAAGSLIAEMSLASLTLRRHAHPVNELLNSAGVGASRMGSGSSAHYAGVRSSAAVTTTSLLDTAGALPPRHRSLGAHTQSGQLEASREGSIPSDALGSLGAAAPGLGSAASSRRHAGVMRGSLQRPGSTRAHAHLSEHLSTRETTVVEETEEDQEPGNEHGALAMLPKMRSAADERVAGAAAAGGGGSAAARTPSHTPARGVQFMADCSGVGSADVAVSGAVEGQVLSHGTSAHLVSGSSAASTDRTRRLLSLTSSFLRRSERRREALAPPAHVAVHGAADSLTAAAHSPAVDSRLPPGRSELPPSPAAATQHPAGLPLTNTNMSFRSTEASALPQAAPLAGGGTTLQPTVSKRASSRRTSAVAPGVNSAAELHRQAPWDGAADTGRPSTTMGIVAASAPTEASTPRLASAGDHSPQQQAPAAGGTRPSAGRRRDAHGLPYNPPSLDGGERGTPWSHLSNAINSFLGMAGGGGGSGVAGLAATSSRRASALGVSPGGAGRGAADAMGRTSAMGSMRRRSAYTPAEEPAAALGGGGGAGTLSNTSSGPLPSAARITRRRSVIEISGNTMILNAPASQRWVLDGDGGDGSSDLYGSPGGAYGSITADDSSPIRRGGVSQPLPRQPDAPRRRRSKALAAGPASPPGGSSGGSGDASGSSTRVVRHQQSFGTHRPRALLPRRPSQLQPRPDGAVAAPGPLAHHRTPSGALVAQMHAAASHRDMAAPAQYPVLLVRMDSRQYVQSGELADVDHQAGGAGWAGAGAGPGLGSRLGLRRSLTQVSSQPRRQDSGLQRALPYAYGSGHVSRHGSAMLQSGNLASELSANAGAASGSLGPLSTGSVPMGRQGSRVASAAIMAAAPASENSDDAGRGSSSGGTGRRLAPRSGRSLLVRMLSGAAGRGQRSQVGNDGEWEGPQQQQP